MQTIHVQASRSYDVLIGEGLLPKAGEKLAEVISPCRAVIVSDDNVFALYGETLRKSLQDAGFEPMEFVFPHGESSKNLSVYGELLETMCAARITRSDCIVALGGGVVGDLAGFAAATYQRGIAFAQIPTSLLAAVDSSVGGKTAVDLPSGKNQVGCFYQPSVVLCDTDTFKTLPEAEYRNGCAEIIKYAMIGSSELFAALEEKPVSEQYEAVVSRCVSMKRDFVEQDEFDRGLRMMLNFGHTFGHAVESCSQFAIAHGQAVAMGMAAITESAVKRGFCEEGTLEKLTELLKSYHLNAKIPYPAQELFLAAGSDKKSSGGSINLIVPQKIGCCTIEKIKKEELLGWLQDGGIQ